MTTFREPFTNEFLLCGFPWARATLAEGGGKVTPLLLRTDSYAGEHPDQMTFIDWNNRPFKDGIDFLLRHEPQDG